jgi:hypothetical protein
MWCSEQARYDLKPVIVFVSFYFVFLLDVYDSNGNIGLKTLRRVYR